MAVTRFGLTWWGQRWIAALETLGRAYANRLPRGRTYARNGSVTDLTVAPGVVTARVHGSRRTPYRVSLRIPTFTDPQWTAATHALARQLRHAAALLDGRMPEDIDETLDAVGLSLFPTARELATTCSCPDEANPCKHVAAVHYTLAHTFDADPFLLPALRGRDRITLLAALRAARTGIAEPDPDEPTDGGGVPISTLSAATLFGPAGDLTTIPLRPDDTTDPDTTLRRLGPPPGFDTLDLLVDAVERFHKCKHLGRSRTGVFLGPGSDHIDAQPIEALQAGRQVVRPQRVEQLLRVRFQTADDCHELCSAVDIPGPR